MLPNPLTQHGLFFLAAARALLATKFDKGLGEATPWVIATEIEEGVLIERVVGFQGVEAELEGDLLIGTSAFQDGNSRHGCLEVEEVVGGSRNCGL